MFAGNFAAAIQQFDTNSDGVIDFKEFRNLNQKFPMLLFPAFRMQEGMQKLTLGASTWQKILEDYKTIRECPRGQTPVYRFFYCFKKKNEVARNRKLRVDVHYIDNIRPRLTAFVAEARSSRARPAVRESTSHWHSSASSPLPSPASPCPVRARVGLPQTGGKSSGPQDYESSDIYKSTKGAVGDDLDGAGDLENAPSKRSSRSSRQSRGSRDEPAGGSREERALGRLGQPRGSRDFD